MSFRAWFVRGNLAQDVMLDEEVIGETADTKATGDATSGSPATDTPPEPNQNPDSATDEDDGEQANTEKDTGAAVER